ncbi:MAG: crossover junction endodeoxyribonuclease RuvC [Deltaproteobacteria bacterium]|nr:crossover junction endodeoxyribonuclease RuvC [Deltaproteobacteria bacterium]
MPAGDLILGLDPGSLVTGYGLIVAGPGADARLVETGVIRAPAKEPLTRRLIAIHQGVAGLIARLGPAEVAIEDVFSAKNPRAALALGQARAAAILAAALAGLPVHEYSPAMVKKALVGHGQAGKEQVAYMVCQILHCPAPPALDASDALAVALMHHAARRLNGALGARP